MGQQTGDESTAAADADFVDPQEALLGELVTFMTKFTPSVQHLLERTRPFLAQAAGLSAATVFELDPEAGLLRATAQIGPTSARDVLSAGKVFRAAAGAAPMTDGPRMAIRLRIGGQTIGVLLLTGTDLAALRRDVLTSVALHFAATVQALVAETQRQFITHTSAVIRRMFEQGVAANSLEEAGNVLAAASAEAFRADRAAVVLVGDDLQISYVSAVGMPDADEKLRALVGRSVAQSPVWTSLAAGSPFCVADVRTVAVRPAGLLEIMGVQSYLALPLMSARGPVGLILCGNTAPREWSKRELIFAGHLSMEGALIVDGAGMRQAAQAHVADLHHQAFHDALTGLPNRTQLLNQADVAVQQAAATGTRVALMMLDLNGFKQVNDTAGHQVGDILLQRAAQRLHAAVRTSDMVARLGGDEFAILLTGDPGDTAAAAVANRICATLREPFTIDGTEVIIGGSVGIALYPDDATDYTALMRRADEAMYQAKRDTKHRGGGARRAHPAGPLSAPASLTEGVPACTGLDLRAVVEKKEPPARQR